MDAGACHRCNGSGLLAPVAGHPTYNAWLNLPTTTAALVRTTRPIACFACGGTGQSRDKARAESVKRRISGDALCAVCADEGFLHFPVQAPTGVHLCTYCYKLEGYGAAESAHALICGCSLQLFIPAGEVA